MVKYKYSTQAESEHTACAVGRDLGISTKASVEICRWLRYRNLKKAQGLLQEVIIKKKAVPYLRFNRDVGHKPGKITSGRFPFKASQSILNLLNSVQKNAMFKDLDIENLKIVHINAHKASTPFHQGRRPGRAMKRTHVEIVVAEEKPAKKTKKVEKKPALEKVEKKIDIKPDIKNIKQEKQEDKKQ